MCNKAKEFSINKIVQENQGKGCFFEIPPYQRLYEWEKEQIETLLEDVKKACFNAQGELQNKIYFIGNVVVSQQNGKYILIDGQQRLTTLFLIGVYFASKNFGNWGEFIAKQDKQIRISMPLREEEEKWLLDFIKKTRGKGFGENLIASSSIHEKILGGLKTIQTWFEQNFKDNQEREGCFSTFLYNNVCFALVELAEDTDLNQFFVRMNNRGKQLEKHEILKAKLLGILQKNNGSDKWEKYAKIWDLCSDMDKYIFQSVSDRSILNSSNDGSRNISDVSEPSLLNILTKENVKNNGIDIYENNGVERVKSIIDFPTFLLHVAKLVNKTEKDIPINKDKLLENIVSEERDGSYSGLVLNTPRSVEKFILSMLKYRVLFDYFVIKRVIDENLSRKGEYSIRRLYKPENNPYYSIGVSVMDDLGTVQNYLRVAREGDKQNYHHWLTSFLGKVALIAKFRIEITEQGFKNIVESVARDSQKEKKEEEWQKECIDFLERLDKDLAIQQMNNNGDERNLLSIAKKWLNPHCELLDFIEENFGDFVSKLNSGTKTPHYWFYRLEYYLWKNRGSYNVESIETDEGNITFEQIADKYRFRGLNSIEHIQPQSKAIENNWNDMNINCFGNLALISQSFNSSLSDQRIGKKFEDIKERIRDNRVESLKMCLAYIKCGGKNTEWNPETAKKHQDKMLEVLKVSLENKKQNRGLTPSPSFFKQDT